VTESEDNRFAFFGCHQAVTQGTVMPTKYEVVHSDNWSLSAGNLHMLTMQLTMLYQNWPGPIRVPAPVKYAETCARKVTAALKNKLPSEKLSKSLWFL